MDIGSKLYSLLAEKGVTQTDLARSLNLATSTLNGYIRNKRQPDAQTLIRLAAYFHTSTDYIYGITSSKEVPAPSYSAEEHRLINLYRATSKDTQPLFVEIVKTISSHGKSKAADQPLQRSETDASVKTAERNETV